MKKIFMHALVLSIMTTAVATGQAQTSQVNIDASRVESFMIRKNDNMPTNFKGSPYIQENWVIAEVEGYEGRFPVKYNAERDAMEFKDQKGVVRLLSRDQEFTIRFQNGSQTIYQTFNMPDGSKSFGVLIWEDEEGNKLYRKEVVEFLEASPAQTSYERDTPATFERIDNRYFVKKNNIMYTGELPKTKKRLKKYLYQVDVDKFIKENKLNVKQEKGLIQLVKYYFNELETS